MLQNIDILVRIVLKITNIVIFHSRKKRKNSLERHAVLLIFSVELEISGVVVQSIHQSSKKRKLLPLLSKNGFKSVLATSCCYEQGAKAFRRFLQIIKRITNTPCELQFAA